MPTHCVMLFSMHKTNHTKHNGRREIMRHPELRSAFRLLLTKLFLKFIPCLDFVVVVLRKFSRVRLKVMQEKNTRMTIKHMETLIIISISRRFAKVCNLIIFTFEIIFTLDSLNTVKFVISFNWNSSCFSCYI